MKLPLFNMCLSIDFILKGSLQDDGLARFVAARHEIDVSALAGNQSLNHPSLEPKRTARKATPDLMIPKRKIKIYSFTRL
jgi:hypothetical protein